MEVNASYESKLTASIFIQLEMFVEHYAKKSSFCLWNECEIIYILIYVV